jgi:DNA-binding winged helix-turn-helix (wHTH) protein
MRALNTRMNAGIFSKPALARLNPASSLQLYVSESDNGASAETAKIPYGHRTEIKFGPFRLFPAQFLLLEGEKPVLLGSRALEILAVLLERPGELISKGELMTRIWPNLFVEPANLSVHISALRRALADGRGRNRFIINIPGRGYVFVAPVSVFNSDKPAANRDDTPGLVAQPDFSAVA